ncbi:MAG: dTMP kinase [Deferrisoma sp.]
MRGVFLTFEGGEGTGKSTQARLLAERLSEAGWRVRLTREPGDTPLGRTLRKILLTPSGDPPCPLAELLLYAADRAEHVEKVVRPALEAGEIVICDRFADATEAYQGWGRGLDLGQVRALNRLAAGGLVPDRTVLLDLDPREGVARSLHGVSGPGAEIRFEQEKPEFHDRVRRGYLAIAAREPGRVRVVDAGGTPEDVAARVWAAVADLFQGKRG